MSDAGGAGARRASRRHVRRREIRAGDIVQVRPVNEILATLDDKGTIGGMPFMPEMLQFAGGTFTVHKRADKTCDTTRSTGLRRMRDTVHLAELRCDGSAHGGCQAGCLLYWNEQWLRRPGSAISSPTSPAASTPVSAAPAAPAAPAAAVATAVSAAAATAVTEADLQRLTRAPDGPDGTPRFTCQVTEVFTSTTPLPWWNPTQYWRDLATRNATIREVVVGIARWLSVRIQWRINGSGVPGVKGRLRRTPKQQLDLQPGERVRIKSRREIEATLDIENRNRGLRVDPDQLLFCGREFRVLRRINRIIDERTREMVEIPGDCILLDGGSCTGAYNRACPRSDFPYWREIWLERLEAATRTPDAAPAAVPSPPRPARQA